MTAAPRRLSVATRIITDEASWDAIRNPWEELYNPTEVPAAPLNFDWLRSWWRVYGAEYGAGLRIVTVWRGRQLIGALPVYLHREPRLGCLHLRFISTGESEHEETCPDYMNLLCLPGEESVCAAAAWRELCLMAWDHLELLDCPDDSPLLLKPFLPKRALTFPRGSCPVADLSGGFESYLMRLTANSRRQARRWVREGENAGAHLEIVEGERAWEALDDLVRLHQNRWASEGKPGAFSSARFCEFHRNLIREWLPAGKAVLARLCLKTEPLAVIYGFVAGPKFDGYQCGISRETSLLRSPGNTAHLLLMQALIERGVTQYDFLRGSSFYKQRLATRANPLVKIEIWRPGFRAAVARCAVIAGRIIAKSRYSFGRNQ